MVNDASLRTAGCVATVCQLLAAIQFQPDMKTVGCYWLVLFEDSCMDCYHGDSNLQLPMYTDLDHIAPKDNTYYGYIHQIDPVSVIERNIELVMPIDRACVCMCV